MSEDDERVRIQGTVFRLGAVSGALVIYGMPSMRGRQIKVRPASSSSNWYYAEREKAVLFAHMVERRVNGKPMFVAVFPQLTPGLYVVDDPHGPEKEVTILPGEVAEMDWRR